MGHKYKQHIPAEPAHATSRKLPETEAALFQPHNHESMLHLQRTVGNRAAASLVKPTLSSAKKVQRIPYNRHDNTVIHADVAESPNKITMTGNLRSGPEQVTAINSNLDFKRAVVPLSNVDNSAFMAKHRQKDTFEITVMQATPNGRRIGQVLAYHLALMAEKEGIEYITAKNVTTAREPFYTPLGFRDVQDGPLWADLVRRKNQIEQDFMAAPDGPNAMNLIEEKNQVLELMAANTIFISTAALLQNAYNALSVQWQKA